MQYKVVSQYYEIAFAWNAQMVGFSDLIQSWIDRGWVPQGGVNVAVLDEYRGPGTDAIVISQAMVHE
jgi:hypothetical protein